MCKSRIAVWQGETYEDYAHCRADISIWAQEKKPVSFAVWFVRDRLASSIAGVVFSQDSSNEHEKGLS